MKIKIRVSELTVNQDFMKCGYLVVPDYNTADADHLINSDRALYRYQAKFLSKFGNLILTYCTRNKRFTAVYNSNFKKWQNQGITNKAIYLENIGY